MLNAVADALARHLLQTLPPGVAYRRSALDRLPLPIAHYLSGLLNRRLEGEGALPHSDWFDREAEIVQTASASWKAALRSAAQVPAEAWEETAQTAAQEVLAYLIEPVATLAAWIYDEAPVSLPTATVRARMTAFSAYPYLREIAEGYLDRKGLAEMTRDEFERLLQRIDQRMVGSFGPTDWMVLLDPLFALMRAVPEYDGVPTALLQRFFQAKGFEAFAEALAGAEAYDEAALRTVLQTQPAASPAVMESARAEAPAEEVHLQGEAAPLPTKPEVLEAEPEALPDPAVSSDGEPDEDLGAEPPDMVHREAEGAGDAEVDGRKDELDGFAVPDQDPVAPAPMKTEVVVDDLDADAEDVEPEEVEHDAPEDGDRAEREEVENATAEVVLMTEAPTAPASGAQEEMPEENEPVEDEGQPEGEAGVSPLAPAKDESAEDEPLWKRLARQQGQALPDDVPKEEAEEEPLWKRLAQQDVPTLRSSALLDEVEATSIEATEEEILDVEVVDIEPDLKPDDAPRSESIQTERLRALERRVLGPTATERRDWYIQHLTGGSAAEYQAVLDRLDRASSWTQATQIIGADIFRKHQVNIYSDAAIAFTDAVEAHFRS